MQQKSIIDYMDLLRQNLLFKDIADEDILSFLECAGAALQQYRKDSVIISEQSIMDKAGIILEGRGEAGKLDLSGKKLVISRPGPGHMFGDIISLRPDRVSPVTVTAVTDVVALLIPVSSLIDKCEKNCETHNAIIHNLLAVAAGKYFELFNRINCIIRPTLRDKILFYLNSVSEKEKSKTFNIPYDRAALAEYLNAERSALSRELSRLKKEGIIDYYKNSFKVL